MKRKGFFAFPIGVRVRNAKVELGELMISVAEAIQIIKQQTRPLPVERIELAHALGRFLAEDVIADCDLPPFDRSQMDGYALRAEDLKAVPARLGIVGESAAGKGWHHELKAGEAVRIMTGAPVPVGADSVQQVELTRELHNGQLVEILESVERGKSIVARGSEIKERETVLRTGELINAAMMAARLDGGNVSSRYRAHKEASGAKCKLAFPTL
jgi:molybdopterin molybdotransferase